jgi:peptidoglycan/LPS O-acetylase OafA/YrhL
MTKSNKRPPLDHFEFMDSIRFLTIYLIICGHTLFFSSVMPTDNPYYMESRLQDVSIVFWTNGATITQTFFVISGFFQAFKFIQDSMKKNIVTFSYLWKSILHRYLRLTPIYAFTMLFNASYMYNVQDGPFWPRIQEMERYTCRQNWWSHLLYLNNYFSNTKEMVSLSQVLRVLQLVVFYS